jgi:hypothetical protein
MATKAARKKKGRGGTGQSRKAMAPVTRGSKAPTRAERVRKGGAHATAGSRRKDTERPHEVESTADRNVYDDHNRATYELEGGNPSKRPSRKSTRRAANRSKPDSNLRRRQTRRARSPERRSQMRGT